MAWIDCRNLSRPDPVCMTDNGELVFNQTDTAGVVLGFRPQRVGGEVG